MSRDMEREGQIYRRTLPGGGYVAIATSVVPTTSGGALYHGEVVVERRTDSERRDGHVAPVVARADGATVSAVFQELFPIASSNPLLAAACIKQSARRAPAVAGAE